MIITEALSTTMVSFSCEVCNDTIVKKKLDQHKQRCRGAYFSCIDCSTTFTGSDYRNHTLCISEAEKYEKALYKGKKNKASAKETPQPSKKAKAESKPAKKMRKIGIESEILEKEELLLGFKEVRMNK